jgi:hypothetical protein
LIDVAPANQDGPFLTGEFIDVMFLGHTTAMVNYDPTNGNVFLNNFMSTEPPGIVGDFNDDGTVDAADYVVWRKHNGSTTVLPNDRSSGLVSPADYDDWRANFGISSSGGSLAQAVPEPGAFPAVFVACSAVALSYWRHQIKEWV